MMEQQKEKRVVASIEARMGSSRLPGKVLSDVCGKPALSRLLARLRMCKFLDDIVLATSTDPRDDVLLKWADENGVLCARGSEEDVLQRVVDAQKKAGGEIVVEITGDCILLDPEIVDMGIETFFANNCDIVTNCGNELSFPMGAYVQVFPFRILHEVAETIDDPAVREHVSLYFYEHPEKYRIYNMIAPARWQGADYRLQLDYPEDLIFINEIYKRLEPNYGDGFGLDEIMRLLRREPQLAEINIHCVERSSR